MTRHLVGSLNIHAKDDESVGKDEFLNIPNLEIDKFLNDNGQVVTIVDGIWRWGGECRLEAKFFAQVIGGGIVSVFGEVLLFEGTSENTSDLDGRQSVKFEVPRTTSSNPNPTKRFIEVNNTDEGGDYAHLNFTLRNLITEE
ncbi:MAG: hypothetical protein KME31_16625 [Tolypothrix carrinoi HA7290-LM1]|jgi:hypothetical protein|nr:hypothetical protein [Tolypothrix carrinoi HA7290-LM1]